MDCLALSIPHCKTFDALESSYREETQCLALFQEMEMFTHPVSYSSSLASVTITQTIGSNHNQWIG